VVVDRLTSHPLNSTWVLTKKKLTAVI